ncbi:hypothetical protein HGI30_01945 [Paenibacillus albicereus]|uniref:Uncharacterized protein n=1 Tax=Paenibacillus albicereus TaxID=2726185 RepID=A0A6H2GSR4_9BACL|nr:hypothetical protein [Paenibacillus albicereus]QJC50471.1 hypothetical protein HGI30_01945 [Paenibacillus albicereus]
MLEIQYVSEKLEQFRQEEGRNVSRRGALLRQLGERTFRRWSQINRTGDEDHDGRAISG